MPAPDPRNTVTGGCQVDSTVERTTHRDITGSDPRTALATDVAELGHEGHIMLRIEPGGRITVPVARSERDLPVQPGLPSVE